LCAKASSRVVEMLGPEGTRGAERKGSAQKIEERTSERGMEVGFTLMLLAISNLQKLPGEGGGLSYKSEEQKNKTQPKGDKGHVVRKKNSKMGEGT